MCRLANVVTAKSAGDEYLNQVARQLADFLLEHKEHEKDEKAILDKYGGLMSLPDVYCVYNKARGTALISPDDCISASQRFASLNLPLRVKKFDSGVTVVQQGSQSDESIVAELMELVREHGFVTAGRLARISETSVVLAKHKLLLAESDGKLCRDDSIEGLAFWPNEYF